jgi:hypothetical protein
MSKFDRTDVSIGRCCVTLAHANPGIAVKGTRLACLCGRKILFTDGRWRLAKDGFSPQIDPDASGTIE